MTRLALLIFLAGSPLDWCDLPGNTCAPLPDEPPPTLRRISWCCNADGGECFEVIYISDCSPNDVAIICTWGQYMADGSVECFDDDP